MDELLAVGNLRTTRRFDLQHSPICSHNARNHNTTAMELTPIRAEYYQLKILVCVSMIVTECRAAVDIGAIVAIGAGDLA